MDLRYMTLGRGAGSTWFFVYNIPAELRGRSLFMTRNGRPMTKITESLRTSDADTARERRHQRLVDWDRQFRMMREGPSEDDIREEAIEIYRATLKTEAARSIHWGHRNMALLAGTYTEELDHQIALHVADEI